MASIWFNPELREFQFGKKSLLDDLKAKSERPDDFVILYEFNHTSERLVEKVYQALLVNNTRINTTL